MTSAAPAPAELPSEEARAVPAWTNGAVDAIAARWKNGGVETTAVWRIGVWLVIGG